MASALTASLVRAPFTTSKGEAGPKPCLQAQRVALFPASVWMRTAGPSNVQLKASQRRGSAVFAQEGTTETAQGAGFCIQHGRTQYSVEILILRCYNS